MRKITKKIISSVTAIILPVLFLIIWKTSATALNNEAILPSVEKVFYNFLHAFNNFIGLGSIPSNILYSLVRVFLGYFIGAIVALPLGLAMGYFKPIRIFFETFISLFKPVPSIAWMPLVISFFGVSSLATLFHLGYSETYAVLDNFKISMIFLIALGAFYPIWGATMFGVSNVRKVLIESVEVLGASQKDIFFHVLIPAAGPAIFNGFRNGLTTSWACLIAAEMLPGSMSGIGYLITHAYELTRVDLVVTGIICIGVIGASFDWIFRILSRSRFSWQKNVK